MLMHAPAPGDLLITSQGGSADQTALVVVDAITHRIIGGPFSSVWDAVSYAVGVAPQGSSVWQENLDLRRRALGPPVRLPVRPRGPARRSA